MKADSYTTKESEGYLVLLGSVDDPLCFSDYVCGWC
jgi:hypothetical protein